MSVKDFAKHPYKYCKAHIVTFYGGTRPDSVTGGTGPDATGMEAVAKYSWSGWDAVHYAMKPGKFVELRFQQTYDKSAGAWGEKRIGSSSNNMHTATCFETATDQGIRFLPWIENHVTFMKIDANARTFFTGPLSGCAIYFGQDTGGNWWAFHANRNNSTNGVAVKGSMTKATIDTAGLNVTVKHSAVYKQDYSDLGFAFGEIKDNAWKFYVCDVATKATAGHFSGKVKQL